MFPSEARLNDFYDVNDFYDDNRDDSDRIRDAGEQLYGAMIRFEDARRDGRTALRRLRPLMSREELRELVSRYRRMVVE